MVSTHRYCHAGRQPTRGALTGGVQVERGDVQEPGRTLIAMNTTYGMPAGSYGSPPADPSSTRSRKKRFFRWGAGITLAGFLAGGGIALAAVSGGFWDGTAAASSASHASGASSAQAAELNSAL